MVDTYPTVDDLHTAYASETGRILMPWVTWSQDVNSDGSIEVTVALADGKVEKWEKTASGTELKLV